MAQEKRNPLQRYIDVGTAFTQMTRKRAEDLVRELVREGEVGREQGKELVDELITKSRRSAEHVSEMVRDEVRKQVAALGLTNRQDVAEVVQKFIGAVSEAGQKVAQTAEAATASARQAGASAAGAAVGRTRQRRRQGDRPHGSSRARYEGAGTYGCESDRL